MSQKYHQGFQSNMQTGKNKIKAQSDGLDNENIPAKNSGELERSEEGSLLPKIASARRRRKSPFAHTLGRDLYQSRRPVLAPDNLEKRAATQRGSVVWV